MVIQPLGWSIYLSPIFRVISQHQQAVVYLSVLCFAVVRTDSPLAKLYTTSTLEHHHFNHAVIILSTEVSVPPALQVFH